MAAMMPNGPLQVAFSFDTTGSMSSALTEVRGRLSDMLQRLQTDLPHVTTAVIAHGDYCDRAIYITKHIDFSNNLPELVDFVNNVETTGGGDQPEAYEVMLRLVRKDLSWTPGTQRVLVVIGDAFPHPPKDPQNKDKIDWKKETKLLQEMGVRIYGVQVNTDTQATEFFKTMVDMTGGQHLQLSQFGTLCDVIMAICYREKGAEFLSNYEAEVRAREGRMALHKDLEGVFGVLRRADSSASTADAAASTSATGTLKKLPSLAKTASIPSYVSTLSKVPSVSKLTKSPSVSKLTKAASLAAKAKQSTVGVSVAKKLVVRSVASPKTKVHKICVPRKLNRENVPDTNFRFKQLRWSPWKLAVVPAGTDISPKGQWRRVLQGSARAKTGTVLQEVSKGKKGSVMCEAAVQTRPGGRRHVVWCRVLPAASANRLSLSRLLSSSRVRAQLKRVMRDGCRLWVRWAKVNQGQKEDEVKQVMKDIYDYAWCHSNGSQRDVWVPNGSLSHKLKIAGSEPMDM